jgi:crossover junction endodeoxyribonuclease RusA
MYRSYRGKFILSEEGRQFKRHMAAHIEKMSGIRLIKGPVNMSVVFSFKDRRRRDVDNYAKATLDCLTGVLYDDDSQITELHLYKVLGCEKEGIHIQCSEV